MGRPRIIITCPDTGIAVISRVTYEEMINPLQAPMDFKCPCGATHRLQFAGLKSRRPAAVPPPQETPRAL